MLFAWCVRDSGTRFGRLYVDLVAPVELLPLRGADAGGQRREYIVEWREGDRPADVAQEVGDQCCIFWGGCCGGMSEGRVVCVALERRRVGTMPGGAASRLATRMC